MMDNLELEAAAPVRVRDELVVEEDARIRLIRPTHHPEHTLRDPSTLDADVGLSRHRSAEQHEGCSQQQRPRTARDISRPGRSSRRG
jgi:hypothetical protein